MNNYYRNHTRRYNSYPEYFKNLLGHRVQKLTVDAGFSCPNRDGTLALGGCTFCNNNAFNPSYCTPQKSISQQLHEGVEFHQVRYRNALSYLAYFQAYSNTHAPIEVLKERFSEALRFPGVIGLVIGTRPDCINDAKLDYLTQLAKEHLIFVEYGVESVYDAVLENVNRRHTFAQSVAAIEATAARGLKTGAHFIIGLPGESREMTLNAIPQISALPLHSVKFHQLQIFKNTAMELEYQQFPERFSLYELNDYLNLMAGITAKLNPAFVIERIAGEAPPRHLAAPGWGLLRVHDIVRLFEKKLEEMDVWQGKDYY